MLNWINRNKSIILVVIVFCVMLGLLIKDAIKYNNNYSEEDTSIVDTIYVVDNSEVDTLETIEIDSTNELINSEAVD